MQITGIQVEEGFLDGLDLTFEPGLNVVIGPRGTGKTSLVELLRFALGSEPLTERARSSLRDTVSAVLRGGQVSVSLVNEANVEVTAVRSGAEDQPRSSGPYRPPLVLAQNEIETLGLQPSSRLSLIDRFRPSRAKDAREMAAMRASVTALTSQIGGVARELHSLLEQATEISSLRKQLTEAETDEAKVLERSQASVADRESLRSVQDRLSAMAVRESVLRRTAALLDGWAARLEELATSRPRLEPAATTDDEGTFRDISSTISAIADALNEHVVALSSYARNLGRAADDTVPARLGLEAEARGIRQRLDESDAGAGAITRQVATLREQLARSESLLGLVEQRRDLMGELMNARRTAYAELEEAQQGRFRDRQAIAERINNDLAPSIRVTVESGGSTTEYVAAIEAALRGSGLHAKNLAPLLASRFNPIDLAEAVEAEDAVGIAKIANVALERAVRVVEALREGGTENLVSVEVSDSASFELLDGLEFKSTEALSTGQRCTVVLSIVLTSRDAIVVLDQPEDHLDNAFIVETLVKSLAGRTPRAQTIATTHNPNIPVLGDASQVTVLGSDGTRGFVRQSLPLLDAATIDAITTLMEGGREAFRRRAQTYGLA